LELEIRQSKAGLVFSISPNQCICTNWQSKKTASFHSNTVLLLC